MSRRLRMALGFAASAALVLGALTWVTLKTRELDQERNEAQQAALIMEAERLALWRMDSLALAIVAQEEARPIEHWSASYPAPVSNDPKNRNVRARTVYVQSPLNSVAPAFTLCHFEVRKGVGLSFPYQGGESSFVPAVADYRTRLEEYFGGTKRNPSPVSLGAPLVGQGAQDGGAFERSMLADGNAAVRAQQVMSNLEYRARRGVTQRWNELNSNYVNFGVAGYSISKSFRALWKRGSKQEPAQPELFLVREVRLNQQTWLQGVWLDWPALKKHLEGSINDLLPNAKLVPREAKDDDHLSEEVQMQALASLPASILNEDSLELAGNPLELSAVDFTLIVGWVAVVLGLAAVGYSLFALLGLSERRGRFVAAVTHELRTPLTTFRMYSEMLASGMVKDAPVKQKYLETLNTEAERLSRVVESTLLWSRLEEGKENELTKPAQSAQALIDEVLPALTRCAAAGDREIVLRSKVNGDPLLRCEAQVLEQILLNLVDNSCKYAGDAENSNLEIDLSVQGAHLIVRFRDFGAGIPVGEERVIFEPFRRTHQHESSPMPGVGLGLSLSRELARSIGGQLRLISSGELPGAVFELRLPLSKGRSEPN